MDSWFAYKFLLFFELRNIFVKKDLIEKVKLNFNGSTYLFEHSGKQYSRISIKNRIKVEGKIILNKTVEDLVTSLNMGGFSKGNYLLNVTENNKIIKTYKIIKQ